MRHVWIIDDDEEMSRAVGLMLNLLNCDTTSFLSVRSAVQRLLTGKIPDLLFLDINLPEVSGFEMLEFLRRRPEWKNLPIVILSSEAADVVVDRALELGADSYVMKPVTIDELEKAMVTAFSKHLNV
jgi:two-component system chemotaxis response regulator CheY